MTGRLTGVGVGPGDPELATVKAVRVLREADLVFVPVAAPAGTPPETKEEAGRAEAVVLSYAGTERLRRIAFNLSPDAAQRRRSWEWAASSVAEAVSAGMWAAFATIGDPSIYSTFAYLAAGVRERVPGLIVEVVPGITAFQDLAARSGTSLVEGSETLALLPFTAGPERLRSALSGFDAVACYKGGSRLPEILDLLAECGRLDGAVYGARLGMQGEVIRPAAGMEPSAGPYLSTVIVPPAARSRK